MNDKLQKLYDLYKSTGLIKTTDFNTFAAASDDQKKKLYDLGKNSGLFKTTDYSTFNSAFVKKKRNYGITIRTKTKVYFFGYYSQDRAKAFGFICKERS